MAAAAYSIVAAALHPRSAAVTVRPTYAAPPPAHPARVKVWALPAASSAMAAAAHSTAAPALHLHSAVVVAQTPAARQRVHPRAAATPNAVASATAAATPSTAAPAR